MYYCDLCGIKAATLTDKTVVNNGIVEYRLCESCYKAILKSGSPVYEYMKSVSERRGHECASCGATEADVKLRGLFGCPDCYREMRSAAERAAYGCQNATRHTGKKSRRIL